ncbi:MAG TPA: DNA polymerase III subunit beta [Ktedonobacterales bacterium]|jgi:DNA polymerase-3 subunit beta
MKITCKQQDLAKGLSLVGHAVSTRSTLPILANILITTEEERIRLSATNLEIGVTCWVPATVHAEGKTTLPARLLTDFVNTLPPGTVDLALQSGGGQTVKVSMQRTSTNIRGMDPEEFPAIPSADGSETPVALDAAELRGMIAQVAFAAAADDTRPVFTGVLARIGDDQLTFAAADSFRLAVRTATLPADGGGVATAVGDILIPAKTLSELGRILPDEGTVSMYVTPNRNQVLFHATGVDLVSNLIPGQFPNFAAIVPKTHSTRAVVKTDELRAASKRASLFARDSANIVRIKVEPGEVDGVTPGAVTLSATAEEVGDATDTVDAAVDGPGLEVIFNVKYMTDVLAVLDTPEVALELLNAQSPGVIKPVGKDEQYTYVVMPMHNTR